MSDADRDNPRREFLRKSLTLIPVVTLAGTGLGSSVLQAAPEATPAAPAATPAKADASAYQPSYFTAEEWAFINAAVAQLIPNDEQGPGALEAGVPEYIDRQMNTPYAAGALWYMQGPFNADAAPEMGWQSKLVPKEIYRLGIAATDQWAKSLNGKTFAEQDSATRDDLLKQLEAGKPQFDAVPAKIFFSLLLQNTKEGFFCDPIHGGNKGMVGWTMIGFPGARADFMDWVERNEQYPLPGSFDSRREGLSMATVMKKVDAVIVGFGWTGAIMAKELTEAGLNVLALERGPMQDTYPDGNYPQVIDELTYSVRKKLFQDISKETVTIRHSVNDIALPNRQLGAFLPGNGVGGAGLHWSGVHFRVDPIELRMRSHYEERYGKSFIPKDMTIQDFGVSYEELEPFFDFAEKVFGTSGQAWTVKGQLVGQGKGGNPYAPDRSNPFPLEAQKNTVSAQLFGKAATEVGYKPYNLPSANTSGPYTNPYGAQMGPCNFCGFCSGYVCYMYSKASPNVNILPALRPLPNFELRANAHVLRVNLDSTKSKATGVTYIDGQGREIEQPADLVILGAFQLHNVRLMLLSGIGKPYDPISGEGVVGRNFAYQNMATIKAFFDKDTHTNNFIGAGGNGVALDDFNADNFDHGPHGFVGGSPMWVNQAGSRPIAGTSNPPGTPAWGSQWKRATADYYTHQVSMDAHGAHQSYRGNYLDLDPVYRDAYGLPLLRMTFDWQENDIKMNRFMVEKMGKVAQAMGPKAIAVIGKQVGDHFNTAAYQTTHLNGGAIMGTDPKKSALNRYLQSWDVHNVFVPGASAFPQGLGYNPTGLVAALTYWSAKAIREQYLKNPGPLVQA